MTTPITTPMVVLLAVEPSAGESRLQDRRRRLGEFGCESSCGGISGGLWWWVVGSLGVAGAVGLRRYIYWMLGS